MSEQKRGEPIMLDYARPGPGRFATLWRRGVDIQSRKAGLRLWAFVTLGLYLAAGLEISFRPLHLCGSGCSDNPRLPVDSANLIVHWERMVAVRFLGHLGLLDSHRRVRDGWP